MHSVAGAALIVMTGVMASRVLGLARNVVISHQYGASREYETFLAAISVPDTVFQVLAGGSVGAAFIPVFTSYWSTKDRAEAWRLTSALMNLAVVAIGTVSVMLGVAAPAIMSLLVPGWSQEEQLRAAGLTQMMLVSSVIFAVSTLASSALNSVNRFALSAAAPLMYNLAILVAAITLRPLGAEGLAIGAVVGALLHLAVQIPGLLKVGMTYSLTLGLSMPATREVARLMVPRVFSLGVAQVNQLVNLALASFLVAGSIAYLNYAWLVLMVPLGLFGMSFSMAAFPTLAQQRAASQTEEARATFLFALRSILLTTVPATIGLMVLGGPIVGALLGRGAFGPEAVAATAYALGWYALGLPAHAVVEIVDRVLYADRDTTTPLRVALAGFAVNAVFAVVLMRTPLDFGGLALANSLAAIVEASALVVILHRRTGWLPLARAVGPAWRLSLAAAAMIACAASLRAVLEPSLETTNWLSQLGLATAAGVPALLVFVAMTTRLGISSSTELLRLIRR